jgi:CheY-like chemotaxis protein
VDIETNTATLETAPVARPRGETESERQLREAPKCTILVVDDDEGIREALAEILELSGYRVAVAADGQVAVDMLEVGLEPAAIILDLMMPRMDGWTFLDRLRHDPKHQGIPVVVTSAVAWETPPGADACLQKPFDIAQLDRAVARLCAH